MNEAENEHGGPEAAATARAARMPVVAIVGRPNVGKSSLLNALAGRRISIVQDTPGVTRDRISGSMQIGGKWVELVDTGGWGHEDADNLTDHIRRQIEIALAAAELVVLVVDCSTGLVGADQALAAMLRERGIKMLLVANKDDSQRDDAMLADFARLGMGTPIGVSATQKRNLDRLIEVIGHNVDLADAPTEMAKPQMLLAVVGKRNAGKSTLVNAIATTYGLAGDRVIVSEVPGTTRDSVDVRFEKDGKALVVIDTAGVRKKRRMVADDIAFYSFHRAQRSVRRADVALMLIDGTEPISEPDRKVSDYIGQQFKPLVLVVNKWDLTREMARKKRTEQDPDAPTDEQTLMEEYGEYLSKELVHVDFAPIAFVTAKDGTNVGPLLEVAEKLFAQASLRLTTGRLNAAMRTILDRKSPSTPSGRKAKVFYATQVEVAPPTIVLFVNKASYFDEPYKRFIINRFRELLPFGEVPIKLLVRGRADRTGRPALDEAEPAAGEPEQPVTPKRPAAKRVGRLRTAGTKPGRDSKAGGRRGKTRPRRRQGSSS